MSHGELSICVNLEQRMPARHPLREMKILLDGVLVSMSNEFEQRYARTGRPSIPPECLIRALSTRVLYTVRSERQLVEQLDYNLLCGQPQLPKAGGRGLWLAQDGGWPAQGAITKPDVFYPSSTSRMAMIGWESDDAGIKASEPMLLSQRADRTLIQ